MASLMPNGKQQYFDSNGVPLVGGRVYTYSAGTTTPLATYTDAGGLTPNTNPVILDSRGEASIFFAAPNSYKVVLKNSVDTTIWTQDNLIAVAQADSNLIVFIPSGTGAVATTVQTKLRESVSVKDFGAVGDGVTDDSAAISAAQTYASTILATLYFPAGTYLCKAITLQDITVDGIIKASGSSLADAVVLNGAITAPVDRKIFEWSATNPTNLPGTTYPFVFSTASKFGGSVSVKWFGATGDNSTDDTDAFNACTTAMSFAQPNGSPSSPFRGPVELYLPRGNYRIVGTVNITAGTVVRGQASGSNPLSSLIKNDAISGSTAADMIWVVKDNVTYTQNPAQIIFENVGFYWFPDIDYSSSTLQLDTAYINFKGRCIDVKMTGCWFLGSPQKGYVFKWGNEYDKDPSGTGIVKRTGVGDADGAYVSINCYNSQFDVIYGSVVGVTDYGYGSTLFHSTNLFQIFLGLLRNYSNHSTGMLNFVVDDAAIYGINFAGSPLQHRPTDISITEVIPYGFYRNAYITLNDCYITNYNQVGTGYFFFQQALINATLVMNGCQVDSTDSTARYYYPVFWLDKYVNKVALRGCSFFGSPYAASAIPEYQPFIAKNDGTAGENGITSQILVTGCDIDIGTSNYFIKKDNIYASVADVEVFGNTFSFAESKVLLNTGALTKSRVLRNTFSTDSSVVNQTEWTYPTFSNSWVDYDANNKVAYRIDANGNVALKGGMKSGTIGSIAFTLPVGMRPATSSNVNQIVKAGTASTAYGHVAINHLGQVYPLAISDSSNASVWLDGISFQAIQ